MNSITWNDVDHIDIRHDLEDWIAEVVLDEWAMDTGYDGSKLSAEANAPDKALLRLMALLDTNTKERSNHDNTL